MPQQSGVIESSTLTQILTPSLYLEGYGNEADFLGFCRKWFLISPLHYLSGRSHFGFEFTEISIFEKWLPAITADSPYRWYGESATPCMVESGSLQLPASLIRGVGDSPHHRYRESAIEFLFKLFVSMIRRVVDSLHQWYGESLTPLIVESESRQLRVSPIRRVDDSAYRWVEESTTPRIGLAEDNLEIMRPQHSKGRRALWRIRKG